MPSYDPDDKKSLARVRMLELLPKGLTLKEYSLILDEFCRVGFDKSDVNKAKSKCLNVLIATNRKKSWADPTDLSKAIATCIEMANRGQAWKDVLIELKKVPAIMADRPSLDTCWDVYNRAFANFMTS